MASKKYLVPLGLVSLGSDPASGTEGDIYYNNVSDGIRLYKNGAWTDLMSAGSLPSGGSSGQILSKSSNTDYAVEWIENYADYTETVKLKVKNDGTRELYKGQPVYVTGSDGTNVLVGRSSNATEGGSSKTIGLLAENLATNGLGFVIKEGKLGTLDTSTAGAVGDPVWLGVDGALIYGLSNKPYAPAHLVYLGVVTKKNGSTGEIFVQVQNGFELTELHNVGIGYAETITDNEVLAYDTTSGTWKNQTSVEAGLIDTSATEQTKAGNLIITGNLTVNGTTTTINSTAINVNNQVIFEGATANGFETTLTSIDPTADNTISLPDASGTLALTSHNHTVDSLSNVVITGTPLDDQLLAYDTTSSKWINQSAAAAGLATPADITTALSSYILSTAKGAVDGVASLDSSAFIPIAQIPDLSATYLTPTAGNLAYQPLDQDLTDIVALGSNGLLKKTSGTWSLDTSTYLTSYTETDPVFIASPAGGITSTEVSNWNTAYGWGDHASANYAADSHNHSLDSLSNVVITGTPSAGQVIIWDNPSAKWVNQLLVGLPSQSTHGGKFLTTDGSSASWSTIDLSSYLTTSSASSTYLQITAASTTYAPKAEPTFTGTVVLPSTTSIGDVSATEISYLNNVTSAIQTQIDSKASSSHTHSYQDADSDLTAIAAITSGVGLLKRLGPDTWTIDTSAYITGSSPTISTSLISGTSTFNLINSIATTVNFAGSATTLIIGGTDAGGSTTIRTPAIATTSTSLDLFNTTATTVNFAGAATTFNLGGTPTGTLTATLFGNATTTTKTINIGTGGASGSETNINIGSSTSGATGTVSVYPSTNFVGTVTVPTPTSSGHATTKGYVDALAAGITVKSQVVYVSQTNLNATYANGTSDSSGGLGVGATLTGNVDGALILDGPEVEANQRVLIKDQTNKNHNGIYVVTFAGDGDDPFILTRATDFNGNTSTNGIIKNGAYIFVTSGTTSANDSYVVSLGGTSTTPSGAIKIGTDNIVLAQYSGVPNNISTLGYVTTGTWAATPIDKDYIDVEIARTNDPVFTGHVTVPDPTDDTDATSKQYVDDLIFASLPYLPDIIPLDDLRYEFDGVNSRFLPKFQGEQVAINNPLKLLVTVNGIIQSVDFPEYVWQSMLPREGFMVDSDGYLAFSEVPPAGSTFDARVMLGPNVNSIKKGYPFRAVDILLGA